MKDKSKFGLASQSKENRNKENFYKYPEHEVITLGSPLKNRRAALWNGGRRNVDYCFKEESIDGDKEDKKYGKEKDGFKRRRSNTTDFNMLYMKEPREQAAKGNFLQRSQNFLNKLGRNLSPKRARKVGWHSRTDSEGSSSNLPDTPPSTHQDDTTSESPSRLTFSHNILHSPFKKVPRTLKQTHNSIKDSAPHDKPSSKTSFFPSDIQPSQSHSNMHLASVNNKKPTDKFDYNHPINPQLIGNESLKRADDHTPGLGTKTMSVSEVARQTDTMTPHCVDNNSHKGPLNDFLNHEKFTANQCYTPYTTKLTGAFKYAKEEKDGEEEEEDGDDVTLMDSFTAGL